MKKIFLLLLIASCTSKREECRVVVLPKKTHNDSLVNEKLHDLWFSAHLIKEYDSVLHKYPKSPNNQYMFGVLKKEQEAVLLALAFEIDSLRKAR
ncbi:hypothetical protein [Pedobacter sp.]|uniref:hypothetical protein n=1 Tax=Pedobacter sp. TaxID=1411316 RepID=UPI003C4A28AB